MLKKMFNFFLFFVLVGCSTSWAYNMPIGIPDPGFGLDEAKPPRPANWTSEVPGYYYVEDTSGCSSSLTYGYPGSPICYIPDPIPAGSRVEVHGTYSHTSAGLVKIHGSGTANSPIWVVGESEAAMPTFTKKVMIYGSYVYLEHLHGYTTNNTCFQIGASSTAGYAGDHIMLRNCLMDSNNSARSHGFTTGAYTDGGEISEYILVVGCTLENFGELDPQPTNDQDAHALILGKGTHHTWVLDNTVHHCGGSGIVAGQEGPNWHYTDIQWFFAGRNSVYDTLQAGMSVKDTWHVVFSENNVHDQVTRWRDGNVGGTVGSPSKCFGWKGEPQDYWIINNTCYNDSYGVHGGGTVTGDWHIYVIGNTFHDIYAQDPGSYNGANAWNEAAISLVGGNHVYAINNTIYNSVSGIMTPGTGAQNKYYYIENNIISTITNSTGSHINSENSKDQTVLRNNVIYQPGGNEMIRWGSKEYDLSQFQAAEGKGQGCKNIDPLFVDASTNNFNLQDGSPAKDSGLSDTELTTNVYALYQTTFGLDIHKDITGVIKPQGTGWDIGACEFGEGGSGSGGSGGGGQLAPPSGFKLIQ